MLQPFITPPYSPDLSPPDYFLFPKLKMKLKGLRFARVAEIQEAVTDELKKGPKRGISVAFQKLYDPKKAYIYIYIYICQWNLFWIKKGMFLPRVSSM